MRSQNVQYRSTCQQNLAWRSQGREEAFSFAVTCCRFGFRSGQHYQMRG